MQISRLPDYCGHGAGAGAGGDNDGNNDGGGDDDDDESILHPCVLRTIVSLAVSRAPPRLLP